MTHYKVRIELTNVDSGFTMSCEAEGWGEPTMSVTKDEPDRNETLFAPFKQWAENSYTGTLTLPQTGGFTWRDV